MKIKIIFILFLLIFLPIASASPFSNLLNALQSSITSSDTITSTPLKTLDFAQNLSVSLNQQDLLNSVPFKTARIFNPDNNKWYYLTIYPDAFEISNIPSPYDITFLPTSSQISTATNIINDIDSTNSVSFYNKLRLLNLWLNIKKQYQ